jgi:surface polysaccharide O-acyltransferase-like enzyme
MKTNEKLKQHMRFPKSKILPLFWGVVLLFFISMSYFNNRIFLDKIILCSLIIGMLFFTRIIGNSNGNEATQDRENHSDLT